MTIERITLQQAADQLGVHYMTAYRYVRTGRLPAVKQGAEWRVDPDDLTDLHVGRRPESAPSPDRPVRRWSADPVRLAERLVSGDEPGSWQLIQDALTSGASPEDVYTRFLAPAMTEIGDRWSAGAATVADEHTATATLQRLIGRLGPSFNRPGRKRGTIVVGAAPGDPHGVGTALLADPLRGRGFQVIDLGANVPTEAWLDAVAGAERLLAVGVSVSTSGLDAAVSATVEEIHGATPVPVVVGGGAIGSEAHALRLGSAGWAETHDEAISLFERVATT